MLFYFIQELFDRFHKILLAMQRMVQKTYYLKQ